MQCLKYTRGSFQTKTIESTEQKHFKVKNRIRDRDWDDLKVKFFFFIYHMAGNKLSRLLVLITNYSSENATLFKNLQKVGGGVDREK